MKKTIAIRLIDEEVDGTMNNAYMTLARTFHREGHKVLFLTTLEEVDELRVSNWLLGIGIPFDDIIFRTRGVEETDKTALEIIQIKRLATEGLEGLEFVLAFEQDGEVASMWAIHGIEVFIKL